MKATHSPELKAQVLKAYVETTDSIDVIAERTGVNRGLISKWAKEANLVRTKPVRRQRPRSNVFEGSSSKLKQSEGAWVYVNGIARWQPHNGES